MYLVMLVSISVVQWSLFSGYSGRSSSDAMIPSDSSSSACTSGNDSEVSSVTLHRISSINFHKLTYTSIIITLNVHKVTFMITFVYNVRSHIIMLFNDGELIFV